MEKQEESLTFTSGVLGYPLLFVLLIWLVFWFEIRFGFDFNYLGVRPREWIGLRGVVFSPFIHSDIKHLFNNTIPLFVLSMSLFYFYRRISWEILLLGMLFTGIMTWVIGRPANHIGASGVIYLLASFLFFKGIFSRYFRLIALSLIVVFLYGGMLWFVVPVDPGISWEGHLSGLIVGLIFAFLYKNKIVKRPKFEWEREDYKEEEDEFMQQFDENGNFIGATRPPNDEQMDPENTPREKTRFTYRYVFKKSNTQEE
ncbi:rhomboid family intramembrane serine protease [Antarcticibacterium flavum]|uniref:Rhomboid family intramembrane serine protease n=1 Tax=Antarcticibacterium flavum TaxID=2058175 RepID=A0A5B7X1K8_9FLAO|nr:MULTISPECIES: rhomboid family intramembrane serine protease [Antarcticibacterium]MCM4160455.1 rhomboid family intramembrane serine protease [Antarcticibacterium sp. W02-3]QCY69199.1 rhomboid family intramembrane serine protease [Antarcticibacterium flavum]